MVGAAPRAEYWSIISEANKEHFQTLNRILLHYWLPWRDQSMARKKQIHSKKVLDPAVHAEIFFNLVTQKLFQGKVEQLFQQAVPVKKKLAPETLDK